MTLHSGVDRASADRERGFLERLAEPWMRVSGAREVFRGVPERTLVALLSTGVRGDEKLMFDARIALNPE